ncbi:glycolytic enzyme transcriptional activator [Nitzschia inconspicua]|uniref:Glycolytic enzyme transcriptional activator n=1 Tax=Nitzschia inconspicua TaxID=303405 RepID=A0A9K3KBK2_9STRA|nr:glycolytic enzyme transcriptional activator [Nitzschia inconspicua]
MASSSSSDDDEQIESSYRRYLNRLMAHKGGYAPDNARRYSEAELLEVQPDDVAKFLKQLAYHTATPSPNDLPIYARESHLNRVKNAISNFMPHRYTPWNDDTKHGDPTLSTPVMDVLRDVKQYEASEQRMPIQSDNDGDVSLRQVAQDAQRQRVQMQSLIQQVQKLHKKQGEIQQNIEAKLGLYMADIQRQLDALNRNILRLQSERSTVVTVPVTATTAQRQDENPNPGPMDIQRQLDALNRNILRLQSERGTVVTAPVVTAPVTATIAQLQDENPNPGPAAGETIPATEDQHGGRTSQPEGPAELSSGPKTLHQLWDEYMFGIGGRKPAKDFTPEERKKCRHRYFRRKPVWDCIQHHINYGYSPAAACERIHQCYGYHLSITQILKAFKQDKHRGGHPSLVTILPPER